MMLDEQIKKVLDELIDISKTIETIKAIAEKKDSEILELSRKITDDMHALEYNEDMADDEAAAIAKSIAKSRRERRDNKNFVEQVSPLLTFYAKHGEVMNELKTTCESISQAAAVAESVVYVQKTGENSGQANTSSGIWKTPRPVLAKTKGGITVQFGSVAAAARAFGYNYQDIMNCCYGDRQDINGDTFSFITGNQPHVAIFAAVRTQLLDELESRSAQGTTDTRPAPEITDVRPAKEKHGGKKGCAVRVTFPNGDVEEFGSILVAAKRIGASDGSVHYSLQHGGLCKGHKIERIQEVEH